MSALDKLMSLEGSAGAFMMDDCGEILEHVLAEGSALNETALDLLGHMCVANMAIATMQARGWGAAMKARGWDLDESQSFYPVQGFTLVGFEWSVITDGRAGVIVANDHSDYQAAYDLLAEVAGGGA